MLHCILSAYFEYFAFPDFCLAAISRGGNLRVVLVRVCGPVFFKPTQIIYLVFEKHDLFIYLIEQNVYIFIYCSFTFIYIYICTLFAVCKQSLQINITILASELNI